jgi:multicomponent Na+:H+ antiporter subunit G
MTMLWYDWVAVALMVGGGFFTLIAGLGVLRMQDVYIRMHASTKAGTLGVGMICGAVAIEMGGETAVKAVAVIFFILFTAPIGAHLIARAAWRSRVPLWQHDGRAPARPDFICEDEGR